MALPRDCRLAVLPGGCRPHCGVSPARRWAPPLQDSPLSRGRVRQAQASASACRELAAAVRRWSVAAPPVCRAATCGSGLHWGQAARAVAVRPSSARLPWARHPRRARSPPCNRRQPRAVKGSQGQSSNQDIDFVAHLAIKAMEGAKGAKGNEGQ
eukprot:4875294-Prymnesium_polylepis.2